MGRHRARRALWGLRAPRLLGRWPPSLDPATSPSHRPEGEDKLRTRLRQITRDHTRWGWKTAYSIVRREGWHVNHKRIQRLSRVEGVHPRRLGALAVQ